MDAVKFLREYQRMCNEVYSSDKKCYACPLCKIGCDLVSLDTDVEKVVLLVEQWSKEHPQKTWKDDFLEKYPNAKLGEDGIPYACTRHLGYRNTDCTTESCADCWNQPLEDCV